LSGENTGQMRWESIAFHFNHLKSVNKSYLFDDELQARLLPQSHNPVLRIGYLSGRGTLEI
jgi:hypothetical protein